MGVFSTHDISFRQGLGKPRALSQFSVSQGKYTQTSEVYPDSYLLLLMRLIASVLVCSKLYVTAAVVLETYSDNISCV
jgi:hypothetical protein